MKRKVKSKCKKQSLITYPCRCQTSELRKVPASHHGRKYLICLVQLSRLQLQARSLRPSLPIFHATTSFRQRLSLQRVPSIECSSTQGPPSAENTASSTLDSIGRGTFPSLP